MFKNREKLSSQHFFGRLLVGWVGRLPSGVAHSSGVNAATCAVSDCAGCTVIYRLNGLLAHFHLMCGVTPATKRSEPGRRQKPFSEPQKHPFARTHTCRRPKLMMKAVVPIRTCESTQ